MSSAISSYPVLTDQLRSRFRFSILEDYSFGYVRDDDEHELVPEELGAGTINHRLVDTNGDWDPDRDCLFVRRRFEIQNASCLFGPDGIACSNAEIGVAVIWTSADSKQRGAVELGGLKKSDAPSRMSLAYSFRTAQLRGMVEFSTVMYIREAGIPQPSERFLAYKRGMLLGEIDRYQIQLDGSGSVFPIYEVEEPDQPLWYVRCDWDDPTYDLFSETVAINLNKAHRNYRYIDRNSKTYDHQLLNEIIAAAISVIISKLKSQGSYWDSTVSGTDIQPGSVSQAVNYFISTLGWDVSAPETMAISIRKFMDGKVMK